MPRWIIWLLCLAVAAALGTVAYALKWAGPEFGAGFLVGFFACYIGYQCWRQDAEPHFTEREPSSPPSHQHWSDH